MTRQTINIGITANDATGDTLRSGGTKINDNFAELYATLGGDQNIIAFGGRFIANGIQFEGSNLDDFETDFLGGEPTADRIVTLPDATGTVILDVAVQTLTNKTLTSALLTTPQINDTSANHQYVYAVSELTADRTVTLPLLGSDDTFVFANHTQTLDNKTLTSPILNNPIITEHVKDTNDNNIFGVTAIPFAVNHIMVQNNIAGESPSIYAHGLADTDITLDIAAAGLGSVRINSAYALKPILEDGSGVIGLTKALTIFNNASALAMVLPDGSTIGEIRKYLNKNSGLVTITSASLSNGTSFSIRQTGVTETIWDGTNWHLQIAKNYSSTDADALVYVTE